MLTKTNDACVNFFPLRLYILCDVAVGLVNGKDRRGQDLSSSLILNLFSNCPLCRKRPSQVHPPSKVRLDWVTTD